MQSVVITGVSTGIGYATAKLLTSHDVQVFGSVRNKQDAERLQNELGKLFVPLIFDVTDEDKVKQAVQLVRERLQGKKLWGLINNAGAAIPGALLYMPVSEFRRQLDINLIGQLIVTQAFAPLLGVEKELTGDPGKIINISSVSGKSAYPFMGPYAVSKHGLEAFSESLRRELMIFGIDVIIVGPGAVKTPIWDKARKQTLPPEIVNSVYNEPARKFMKYMLDIAEEGLPVENIAVLLFSILNSKHPKTRYAPVPNKFGNWITSLVPKRWIDRLIAKSIGLIKKD